MGKFIRVAFTSCKSYLMEMLWLLTGEGDMGEDAMRRALKRQQVVQKIVENRRVIFSILP
jgi:hypothetical protein